MPSASSRPLSGPCLITLGRLLADRLRRAGVRRAFGFPGGGSNLDLLEAFEEVGIEWVLTHTEGAATFMACADAEVTRVPGVLVVGNGPGLTSTVTGVAHAWLDRVPLVVVSDRFTDEEAATTGHQVLDQRALLGPVTKLSCALEPAGAAAVVDRAIATCLAPPPGPVHLDIARDAASEEVVDEDVGGRPPPGRPDIPVAEALEPVARRLGEARRPVVLVGLDANDGVAPADLRRLVHAAGAAVLTTYKAKGVYPEGDPRWAGILTGGELERPFLERADLMLSVGVDAVELLGRPWPHAAPVISLAGHERSDADEYLRPALRWTGDLGAAVSGLARLVGAAGLAAGFAETEIGALRDAALGSLRLDDHEPLPGWRIVEAVTGELPERATLTVDAGAHMLPVTTFARPSGPRRFLISNGLATMGFAVPAAVAAALARPDEVAVDELREAVREALARPTGSVIDVRTTGREYGRTLIAIRG